MPYSAGLLASVTLATLLAKVDAGVAVDVRVAGISEALARFITSVKKLGEVIRLAFSKARSRICTRRKTRRKKEGIRN